MIPTPNNLNFASFCYMSVEQWNMNHIYQQVDKGSSLKKTEQVYFRFQLSRAIVHGNSTRTQNIKIHNQLSMFS